MLVDGADVGIAFYVPVAGSTYFQQNIQSVGLSSGKIAYYLRAGLPVIVNETPSISNLVERERCGVTVKTAGEIGKAIASIAREYERYSVQALSVFDRYLDFARGFQEVIRRIKAL